ncbi:DUF4806 domain-containing protein [Aphis craccivora]|uniref:DUF4806 domain-containing protein n=1 Tax=Aphis craccivora TaxID=307492 RepID=A0A6G0X1A3_APHCR|nr:DUF4806 domain-containing protein [Aphis craccivora]
MTVIYAEDDRVNIDVVFPIKNEDELQAFEDILKYFDLRTSLVGKIALLVRNKDLDNYNRKF